MSLPSEKLFRASLNWSSNSIRLSPTPGAFARDHLLYVQETGYFETRPGYFTEREELPSYLLVYSVSGKGQLSYRGQVYSILPGDLFWIDCREHHLYRNESDALWKFYWVHWGGANSAAFFHQFDEQDNGVPIRHYKNHETLGVLFQDLLAGLNQHGFAVDIRSAQILNNLISEAITGFYHQTDSVQLFHPAVQRSIDYMTQKMADPIRLDQLSRQNQISPFHLIKLFSRQTGLTPIAYLQQIRLSETKRLLHQTDWTIDHIAEHVGLIPASYLISTFRRIEGVTPGQYRKRWHNRKVQG